jgi:light-regulated signal transduction histidine kinase (bacteriophytochrome)
MEALTAGEQVDIEFRVDPSTDYETWVWVKGQPIFDEAGDIEYIAGYTRNVTERKEYQRKLEERTRELQRSNESLREFAYIASHDLQEPLRMVSSYVDLLDQEYGDQLDEEAREYMAFAVDGARRMKRMINSLLEYSRVHTQAAEFTETDVNKVVADTRRDLELLIADHDAAVTDGDLPTVMADRDQLGQVFQNLTKNAIEHASTEETPSVTISATELEAAYEFAVSDNGPGIPESQQEEIFKIFQQGSNGSDEENTGIGLAITKRIVQRHGGEIWVESSPGEGATFRFTIPKGQTAPETEGSAP